MPPVEVIKVVKLCLSLISVRRLTVKYFRCSAAERQLS